MHAYMHVCMYMNAFTQERMSTCTTNVHKYTCMQCVRMCMYACAHAFICVCMYEWKDACMIVLFQKDMGEGLRSS